VEGILRSGNPTGAMIKAALCITEWKEPDEGKESESSESGDEDDEAENQKEDLSGKPVYE